MRNFLFKLTLVALAAAGGVVAWQRRNETPASPPPSWPDEPFMTAQKPAVDTNSAADMTTVGGDVAAPTLQTPVGTPETAIGSADMVTRTPDLDSPTSDRDVSGFDDDAPDDQVDDGSEAETDTDEIDVVGTAGPPDVDGGPAADAGVVADRRAEDTEGADRTLPDPPHGPLMTAPDAPADDLTRLDGVDAGLQRALNDQGITTYGQLAAMSDQQVDELQARIPDLPDHGDANSLVEQAQTIRRDG